MADDKGDGKSRSTLGGFEWAERLSDYAAAAAVILLSIAVIAYCVVVWGQPEAGTVERQVWDIIVASFGQVAVITIPVVALQRTNFAKVVTQSLTLSLGSNVELFSKFSPERRKKFVNANLIASLGKKAGDAVFDNVVDPMMDIATRYRTNFKYIIGILDDPPSKPDKPDKLPALQPLIDKLYDPKDYIWLEQFVHYDVCEATDEDVRLSSGPFELWFAFDERMLDQAMNTENVFFREVLHLNKGDLDQLTKLSKNILEDFPEEVLKIKVETRGSRVDLQRKLDVRVVPGSSPLLIVTVENIQAPANHQGLSISFVMPQRKAVNRFVVALPQPTERPEIQFSRSKHQKNLEPVRYLSRLKKEAIKEMVDGVEVSAKQKAPQDPVCFNLKIGGWSFPTSGMMFVWEDR